jgi:hypothetical protein
MLGFLFLFIPPGEHKMSVFIANVSWGATEQGLREYLESLGCGPINNVRIITHRDTGTKKKKNNKKV